MQYIIKWILLLTLFAPILYFAFKQKKWYLYLLVAFTTILPEQLSISIHDKLPLISATRVLIVIAAAFWFYQRIKTRNFKFPVSIIVFLGINILISVIHLFSDTDEINRMFLFVMERALVMVILADMVVSREELDRCVDFLILGSCAVAIMGIGQTVFGYDIASVMHLRETVTSAMVSDRMGLTRAYATTNAISYGCYCAFMVLPIYYRLQGTGKQRYTVAFALNVIALFATFTRSAWLCIVGAVALVFLTRPWKMLKSLWPSVVVVLVLCLCFSLIQPKFGAALSETGKSTWNTLVMALPESWFQDDSAQGSEGTEDPSDPTEPTEEKKPHRPTFDLSDNFGDNANNPTYSRMFQWSAVRHMAQEGKLVLGNGYNAFRQGQIYFIHRNWGSEYMVAPVLDVGLVSIIAESGLVGLLSYLLLLGYMLVQSLRKRDRKGGFDFYKLIIFTIPLYLLLNFLSAFINAGVVYVLFGLFYAYERLDGMGNAGKTLAEPEKKWQF